VNRTRGLNEPEPVALDALIEAGGDGSMKVSLIITPEAAAGRHLWDIRVAMELVAREWHHVYAAVSDN